MLAKTPENQLTVQALLLEMLATLDEGLNIRPERRMSARQMEMATGIIVRQFRDLCPAALPEFVDRFLAGAFGKIYEGLDVQKVCGALALYLDDYRAALVAANEHHHAAARKYSYRRYNAEDNARIEQIVGQYMSSWEEHQVALAKVKEQAQAARVYAGAMAWRDRLVQAVHALDNPADIAEFLATVETSPQLLMYGETLRDEILNAIRAASQKLIRASNL